MSFIYLAFREVTDYFELGRTRPFIEFVRGKGDAVLPESTAKRTKYLTPIFDDCPGNIEYN
jgi:hypothetical protein